MFYNFARFCSKKKNALRLGKRWNDCNKKNLPPKMGKIFEKSVIGWLRHTYQRRIYNRYAIFLLSSVFASFLRCVSKRMYLNAPI